MEDQGEFSSKPSDRLATDLTQDQTQLAGILSLLQNAQQGCGMTPAQLLASQPAVQPPVWLGGAGSLLNPPLLQSSVLGGSPMLSTEQPQQGHLGVPTLGDGFLSERPLRGDPVLSHEAMRQILSPPTELTSRSAHTMEDYSSEEHRSKLVAAMQKLLPAQWADFQTAQSYVPHLVEWESNPSRYIFYHKGVHASAASQLAAHWKRRRDSFGERMLLPLSLGTSSALTLFDKSILTDICVLLPNDKRGRAVLLFDHTKQGKKAPPIESIMRIAYWFGYVLLENDCSQVDGFVCLVLKEAYPQMDPFHDLMTSQFLQTILANFPVKIHAKHVFGGQRNYNQPTYHWKLDNTAELYRVLEQQHELLPVNIPEVVGGKANSEFFLTIWMPQRKSLEATRYFEPEAVDPSKGAIQHDATPPAYDQAKQLAKLRKVLNKAEWYADVKASASLLWSPQPFLKLSNGNINDAVARIERYWTLRLESFGPVHAYKNLIQTGEDALDRKDLGVFSTGFCIILPNDAAGASVLWLDPVRLRDGNVLAVSRDRCLFYMCSLLTENERSQTEGAVFMFMIESPPFTMVDWQYLERLVNALPLKFKSIHILAIHHVSEDVTAQAKLGDCENVFLHVAGSKDELAAKLSPFGLKQADLPKRINGKWGYERFVQWQEMRTRYEWKIPAGLSGREIDVVDLPAIRPYKVMADSDKTERKRRLNVIHSRRKRDRERIELGVLREQISSLEDDRSRSLQENRVLEELTTAALSILGSPTESKVPVAAATPTPSLAAQLGSLESTMQRRLGSHVAQFSSDPFHQQMFRTVLAREQEELQGLRQASALRQLATTGLPGATAATTRAHGAVTDQQLINLVALQRLQDEQQRQYQNQRQFPPNPFPPP